MGTELKKIMKELEKEINKRLRKFFKEEIREASKIDPTLKEATEMVADFTLRGGKRIRSILMYYGYLATGKRRTEKILDASLSMELIHSALLIHDDIIDNDEMRRGKLTLHKEYEKFFWKMKVEKSEELGRSLAILCGNIAYSFAVKVLHRSKFDARPTMKACSLFQSMFNHTQAGEIMDVIGSTKKNLTIKDVIKIYKYKTVQYTIEYPLLMGALLGNGKTELRNVLSKYAVLLGTAFQIRDDILGIFSDSKTTGKDAGSDLREGKKTVIILKTLENASPKDKKKIETILESKELTKKKLNDFKKIAKDSGALTYCNGLANNLSVQAKDIILKSTLSKTTRDFFLESADYMTKDRKK
ncbi:MAG: polyprenyl synthetase family protein [Patescibacteria group bacterium]|nr:polyprenyl synthetase family protein [Patescibacteria group bacterium]